MRPPPRPQQRSQSVNASPQAQTPKPKSLHRAREEEAQIKAGLPCKQPPETQADLLPQQSPNFWAANN